MTVTTFTYALYNQVWTLEEFGTCTEFYQGNNYMFKVGVVKLTDRTAIPYIDAYYCGRADGQTQGRKLMRDEIKKMLEI